MNDSRETDRPVPEVSPWGAPLRDDHPAEVELRSCKNWKRARRLVREELLLSSESSSGADALMAARILPVIFYSAAVMDEDSRRLKHWMREIDNPVSIAELASILEWKRNEEALAVLRDFASNEARRRQEVIRVAEGFLRRNVNPLAQAIAPAVFTPEGVERTRALLHARVFGQDDAIEAVIGRLEIAAAGLADANKPLGSFLFLGPTGVGKTEVARVLAESLPDGAAALATFDMGRFTDPGDVTKLVGWTIGGYGAKQSDGSTLLPDGAMVAHVRKHPYSVLLFDEIEKADQAIHDVLLSMFGDARVQDQYGENVSLADALIVLTSNVDADDLQRVFRREMLNRIDETIAFNPLTRDILVKVFDKLFSDEKEKYLHRRGIRVEITPAARDYLIELSGRDDRSTSKRRIGFISGSEKRPTDEPREMGARPLRRVIARTVERQLASAINRGKVVAGDRVLIDCATGNSGGLSFERVDGEHAPKSAKSPISKARPKKQNRETK